MCWLRRIQDQYPTKRRSFDSMLIAHTLQVLHHCCLRAAQVSHSLLLEADKGCSRLHLRNRPRLCLNILKDFTEAWVRQQEI